MEKLVLRVLTKCCLLDPVQKFPRRGTFHSIIYDNLESNLRSNEHFLGSSETSEALKNIQACMDLISLVYGHDQLSVYDSTCLLLSDSTIMHSRSILSMECTATNYT